VELVTLSSIHIYGGPSEKALKQAQRTPGLTRQAGDHWSEPSTAHLEGPLKRAFLSEASPG
jgi:hypothetical protein